MGALPSVEYVLRTLPQLLAVMAATPIIAACSSQQLYATGQNWQRNQCYSISDPQERSRCFSSANTSFDEYKRQSDAAKGTK
jgi:hypothetical protein